MRPMKKVFVQRYDHVALVTLNRPEKSNALDAESICLLSDALDEIEADQNVRVAIITGAGKRAFSSGADLETVVPLIRGMRDPQDAFERRLLSEPEIFKCCLLLNHDVGKPIIAAVNGAALAGGMELVEACDMRIASQNAGFGLPEIRWGLFPSGGSTVRLPRQIALPRAMEMLLTGDPIDARTALDWGLVNRVVPPEQLLDSAFALARRIASYDPVAVRAIRRSARQSGGLPEGEALAMEAELAEPVLRRRPPMA